MNNPKLNTDGWLIRFEDVDPPQPDQAPPLRRNSSFSSSDEFIDRVFGMNTSLPMDPMGTDIGSASPSRQFFSEPLVKRSSGASPEANPSQGSRQTYDDFELNILDQLGQGAEARRIMAHVEANEDNDQEDTVPKRKHVFRRVFGRFARR